MYTAEYADLDTSLPLLVRRAKDGDPEAWGEIVHRFTSMVDISVRKVIKNYHIAEDVRQDVFVHAFQNIGTLREVAAFPQWLRIIARRMAINRMRREQKVQIVPLIEDVGRKDNDASKTPLDILIMRECADNLHAAMRTLPPIYYGVVDVFHVQGKDLQETADKLSVPIGTIKSRLHSARHRLRDKLERTFFS